MVSNCTIWPSELDQKGFPLFFRVTFHTGQHQRVPTFNFVRHCETFFRNFFPQMVPPAFFLCFATEWMLKNPKGSPFSVFFGIVRFFPKIKKNSSIFSCFATEWMLKNLKGSPFSLFRHCETFLKFFFSKGSPLQLRQKC